MKNFLLFLLLVIGVCSNSVNAESTVYLFVKTANSSDVQVFCDGNNVCDLNGPVKKTMDGAGTFKQLYKVAHPSYRKLVFNKEGKVVISVESDFTNCMNLKHTIMKGEIQLDLEDGETYYLDIKGKGLNDMQIKQIEKKKADKILSDQKWKELPTVNISM